MTKLDAVLEMEALARKYRELADAALLADIPERDSFGFRRCQSALLALEKFGDRHSLPLFEEMTGSAHSTLRLHGLRLYVRIAGAVDALPFIEGLAKNPRVRSERLFAYMSLKTHVLNTPPPPEEMTKVLVFMLEKIQTEPETIVEQLDEALVKYLPGYNNSVQRAEVMERLANSANEYRREYGTPIKEEIEKVPANQRKDFRAKGELLDPERKGD